MINIKEKKEICRIVRDLYFENILNLEGGGVSIRLKDGRVLATPTGSAFRRWAIDYRDVVVTDIEGRILEKGSYLAMAEFPLDLHIFRKFKDCRAVFHCHGKYSLVFACLNRAVEQTTNHIEVLGDIPCLKSSDEYLVKQSYLKKPYPVNIPEAVVQRPEVFVVFERLMKEFDIQFSGRENEINKHGLAFLVEKHGLFCFARTLDEAIENSVRVEASARTAIFKKILTL